MTTANTTAAELTKSIMLTIATRGGAASAAASKLADEIEANPIYALQWANDAAVKIAEGNLYQLAMRYAEERAEKRGGQAEDHVAATLANVRSATLEQLVSDYYRGTSTSVFSNAVDAAQRKAASNFVRDTERLVERAEELGMIKN